MKWWDELKRQPWMIRLTQWEYWPSLAFYWPMFVVGPLLALRARHPCFFSAANPAFFTGGMGLESKMDTLQMIPARWRPRTIVVRPGTDDATIADALAAANIPFPLIAKPEVGYRGMAVRKVGSIEELVDFLGDHPVPFLLQEYLDYPEEVGILYYRQPDEASGTISSLTLKEFLAVRGDGRRCVEELMREDDRAWLQRERIARQAPELLDRVPAPGERVALGVVGNHSKGTAFINGNAYIDDRLREVMDRVSLEIEGFFYGRFDIKCRSLEDMKAGGAFRIIELNGVCSEPTHMYDPGRMSYAGALGTVIRHWLVVCRIAQMNHRFGADYLSPGRMIRAILDWRRYLRRLDP